MKFSYDQAYTPPAPGVEIRLGLPGGHLTTAPLRAFVDSGADTCIVPFEHIEPLGAQVDNRRFLRSQWGERRSVDIFLLDVAIGKLRLSPIEVVADRRGDEIILGRNVLNRLVVTLNGPKRVVEIRE